MKCLELLVLVEVLAAEPAEDADREHADERGRNGDRNELDEIDRSPSTGALARKATSDTTATETGLAMIPIWLADRARRHRALGPDIVLDRDVVDDRQHRVDDVAGTAEHRQAAGRERREDRDEPRIAPQQALGDLQQHVEPAGRLQRRRGRDDGDDGQHHVDRGLAGFEPEDVDHRDQADAAEQTQRDATFARTVEETDKDNRKLKKEIHGCGSVGSLVLGRPGAYTTATGILPIFARHSAGPVLWTALPVESTATVTGMSFTSNS